MNMAALPLVAFIQKPVIRVKRGSRGSCKTPVYSIRLSLVCKAVRIGLGL